MADDDEAIHNELEGREAIKDLPIAKLLIERIESAERDYPSDDPSGETYSPRALGHAIAALTAAFVALEREMRGLA